MTVTALWRRAIDALQRPLATASESWVQSKTLIARPQIADWIRRRSDEA